MSKKPPAILYVEMPDTGNKVTSLRLNQNHTHAVLKFDEWFNLAIYEGATDPAILTYWTDRYSDAVIVEVHRIEQSEAVERWSDILEIMNNGIS